MRVLHLPEECRARVLAGGRVEVECRDGDGFAAIGRELAAFSPELLSELEACRELVSRAVEAIGRVREELERLRDASILAEEADRLRDVVEGLRRARRVLEEAGRVRERAYIVTWDFPHETRAYAFSYSRREIVYTVKDEELAKALKSLKNRFYDELASIPHVRLGDSTVLTLEPDTMTRLLEKYDGLLHKLGLQLRYNIMEVTIVREHIIQLLKTEAENLEKQLENYEQQLAQLDPGRNRGKLRWVRKRVEQLAARLQGLKHWLKKLQETMSTPATTAAEHPHTLGDSQNIA